jgi:hypothetical protein
VGEREGGDREWESRISRRKGSRLGGMNEVREFFSIDHSKTRFVFCAA